MHLQALDRLRVCQPNRPQAAADSHSATIRRQLYLFKLLLFYPYVFRPHHDKTMFDISFSYINLHLDHMGPCFDHTIQ